MASEGKGGEAKAQEWDDDTIRDGFLQKSDKKGKNWKRRFLVVDQAAQRLAYYQDNPRRTLMMYFVTEEPKGTVDLSTGVEIVPRPAYKGAPSEFCFEITTPDELRLFACKDQESYDSWTSYIQEAIDGVVKSGRKKPKLGAVKSIAPSVGARAASREGWLLKTGPDGRTWNQRWAVLDTSCKALLYYEGDDKAKMKGFVDLRGVTLRIGLEHNPLRDIPAFTIAGSIHGRDRAIAFCTPTIGDLQGWVDSLNAVISAAAFQLSSERLPPAKQGWLQKADPKGGHWKRRFFRLDPSARTLTYAAAETGDVKGTIDLKDADVSAGTKAVKTPTLFALLIDTVEPARTWYICCEDEKELFQWRDACYAVATATSDAVPASRGAALAGYASSRGVGGGGAGAGAGAAAGASAGARGAS